MKTKLQIGRFTFETKAKATAFMQKFIDDRKERGSIQEFDVWLRSNEDFEFLYALVRRHPHSDNKIGCGIKSFEIVKTVWNNWCLYLTRQDGSRTDFSWRECLKATPEGQSMVKAMRRAVDLQILEYLETKTFKGQLCCLCNKAVAEHVDHVPPDTFEVISGAFLKMQESKPPRKPSQPDDRENRVHHKGLIDTYSDDGDLGRRFTDPTIEKEWQDYHRNQAVLRFLCAFCNLSVVKKEFNLTKGRHTDTQNTIL